MKPFALYLAEKLEDTHPSDDSTQLLMYNAADELKRLTAVIAKLEEALKVADEGREYANELLQIAAVDITKLKKSIDKVSKRSRERAEKITTLEADAARYRWLRDKAIYVDPEQKILRICNVYIKDQISPMTLEAAVDAAIEKTK